MSTLLLVAKVNAPSAACNVYVPARSMLQPVKAATPATAGRGVAFVQASTAPAGVLTVNVTELVLPGARTRLAAGGDGAALRLWAR